MIEPQAVAERQADGTFIVRATCRECGGPLILPCRNEEREFEPDEQALKWADLLMCARCTAIAEERDGARETERAIAERVKRAGIPESFRGLRFEDMNTEGRRREAVAAAWAWADANEGGMLLWGPPGTGKTRLAATAVWKRLQSRPVSWCSVAHLIASLQAAFNDGDRREALRVLTGKGALVLDDLDKIKPSEWALSQLFVAIDRRVSAGAPLFVTANAAPADLTVKFGGPIVSRLFGYCTAFEFDGRDRRLEVS